LPNATLVVDHFHLVALANDALTKVRRRVTWDLRDRRGRRIDPEWANRRRLLRARERLSDKSFAKMWNTIVSEDNTSQILSAWIAKEELRTLLSTVRIGGDPHLTRHRLHRFLAWCIDSQIPELLTLAATIDTWWPEINAFVQTGITNARTEGYNRLVKQVKRGGFNRPSGAGSTRGGGGRPGEDVEVSLEAGDDSGVAGDFAVPAASPRVVAQGDFVVELGLQLWHEFGCGGVVVALLADVGVGAGIGGQMAGAVSVGDTGLEHFAVQPSDSIRDLWAVADHQG
jgi:hypothetical protein